jgi:ATP-dependent RNA helicase RhlB
MVRAFFTRLFSGAKAAGKPLPPPEAASAPHSCQQEEANGTRGRKSHRGSRRHQAPGRQQTPGGPQPVPAANWDASHFRVPACEGKVRFQDLDLPIEILHAVSDLGFQYCTPIQGRVLPHALQGRDVFGQAQTGTGKTAAFLITIFVRLLREQAASPPAPGSPRALVLAPTRELAMQIQKDAEALGKYLPLRCIAAYGGMDFDKQREQLQSCCVDVLVATPGRLQDFRRRHVVHLNSVRILVIDEADRMLDMGFIPDVRSIVNATPDRACRQTLFFGATLTAEMRPLASQWTRDPVTVEIEPSRIAVDTVEQVVYLVTDREKFALLYNLLQQENARRVIVFSNWRNEAERLCRRLQAFGVPCSLISGDIPQPQRTKTLERFRQGTLRVLVATDVAARGIHVEGITQVINYNMPHDPEDYVHRIGRTGRAGATGTSISFATESDALYIPDVEHYIGYPLACTHPDSTWLTLPSLPAASHVEAPRDHTVGRTRPPRRRRRPPRRARS